MILCTLTVILYELLLVYLFNFSFKVSYGIILHICWHIKPRNLVVYVYHNSLNADGMKSITKRMVLKLVPYSNLVFFFQLKIFYITIIQIFCINNSHLSQWHITKWRLMDEKLDGRQLEFFVLIAYSHQQ